MLQDFDYGKVLEICVDLTEDVITATTWYEMRREQSNCPALSVANPVTCSFCLDDLTSCPSIKCLECEKSEVTLCVECFKLGAQSGEHRRGHNYKINDPIGPKIFVDDDSDNAWGCFEDLNLLSSFIKAHLDQWPDISKDSGRERTIAQALDRIDKFFLRGVIGDYVLGRLKEIPLKLAIDEEAIQSPKLPPIYSKPITRKGLDNGTIVENGYALMSPSRLSVKMEDGCYPDSRTSLDDTKNEILSRNQTPLHSPVSERRMSLKMDCCPPSTSGLGSERKTSRIRNPPFTIRQTTARQLSRQSLITEFAERDDSDSASSMEPVSSHIRRSSTTRGSTSSRIASNMITPPSPQIFPGSDLSSSRRNSSDFKPTRKEILENAKNEATEVLRSRLNAKMRKSSLELSEALNVENDGSPKKRQKIPNILPDERLIWLRQNYPNSYFYDHKPQPMSNRTIAKFDEEDLQMLGYMPHRDDFEREYKNEAEQLISRISFPHPIGQEEMDTDVFLNAVRLARIHRYNRVLKSRVVKKGVILEHDIVSEFFNVAKNNISEKGKYNVLDEKYFTTKRKEEDFKPLFYQLRQFADRDTIKNLAKSIGKMETLIDQLQELKQLQRNGVKELKGKLKVDTRPPSWSRKRKSRRFDNTEQRKASNRWKRIKRWNIKQSQASETDD
ncbi:transcriptional adapter 2-beta [Ditylenchus destructor]|uniref:Transcriptional adapter 2-beta n=1 Tax=Ditylenchus destructor TaxID=166010 RepID=A0AAD4NB20_9BILA|nr:transcriptional adapter 2-beta [Ditylenchus destructor]